jgi:hypothetical protein
MAVRIRYKIEASVSSTSAEEKDLGNVSYEVTNDISGEGGTRKTFLVAAATDVALDLGNVADAKFILIRTNARTATDTLGTIEIKKNGVGGEVIDVVPLSGAKEAHFLLTSTGITALFASNPGTVDTEITVVSVGD